MKSLRRGITLIGLMLFIAACSAEPHAGPPTIDYGHDVCADCGMIISEERFAAAIVDAKSDAPALLFDDIGCMLSYERKHPVAQAARYFHDASTRQWLTEHEAHFIKSAHPTPMGSGFAAFASPSDAHAYDGKDRSPTIKMYEQILRDKS